MQAGSDLKIKNTVWIRVVMWQILSKHFIKFREWDVTHRPHCMTNGSGPKDQHWTESYCDWNHCEETQKRRRIVTNREETNTQALCSHCTDAQIHTLICKHWHFQYIQGMKASARLTPRGTCVLCQSNWFCRTGSFSYKAVCVCLLYLCVCVHRLGTTQDGRYNHSYFSSVWLSSELLSCVKYKPSSLQIQTLWLTAGPRQQCRYDCLATRTQTRCIST